MNSISCTRRGLFTLALLATFTTSSLLVAAPATEAPSVAAGNASTAVVKGDGTLWTWGNDAEGQLGADLDEDQLTPLRIGEGRWLQVASGAAHKVAIREDGTLWTWGRNSFGQLGRTSVIPNSQPGRVGDDSDWIAVAAGDDHTLAIKGDGSLWAWGSNSHGQLGIGMFGNYRGTPQRVGSDQWRVIAGGGQHSLAIRYDGSLWAWGSNGYDQLGLSSGGKSSPTQVGVLVDWKSVAAGWSHSLATRTDGTLWAWGRNLEGQLGIGADQTNRNSPVQVSSAIHWNRVAAGAAHSLALASNGQLYAFGANLFGQLGDGSGLQRRTPVAVGSNENWIAIAAGGFHSAALGANGVLWTAGHNENGQLGNNSISNSFTFSPSQFGLPDLMLTDLAATDEMALNQAFTINVFGTNVGSGDISTATPLSIEVRLSTVPEWGHQRNVVLGTLTAARAVGTGETFNVSGSISIPPHMESGTYYLGAGINQDRSIVEGDYDNNFFWSETPREFLADLIVDSLTAPEGTVQRGDLLSLSIPVRNIGQGDVPADKTIALQVRISRNTIWGDSDDIVLAASHSIEGGLMAGESRMIELPTEIPVFAPLGDYYLGAWINFDGEITESNVENNQRWSGSPGISISGPPLGEVLNQPDLTWSTGGAATWFGQSAVISGDSDSAAQSPPLLAGEEAWFEAIVEGPAYITFNWKSDTQSENNYLKLTLDGAEIDRIYGDVDWRGHSGFVAPSYINKIRWTYVKGSPAEGDAAWVSDIQIIPVTGPDLVITGIDYQEKTYVLQRDSITIRAYGKNQGVALGSLPPGFKVEVRLSTTRVWEEDDEIQNNITLGNLTKFQDLDSDNRFIYQATLPLTDHIPSGNYYILARADILPEEEHAPYDAVSNNVGWSDSRGVTIERRPDIIVTNLDYEPGIYTIYPTGSEEHEKLTLSFRLRNVGLSDVPAKPFTVSVMLSPNRVLDNGDESILVEFEVSDGLITGQFRPFNVTTIIPPGTSIGDFQYLAVVADLHDDVPESREDNNSAISDLRDILVQDITLVAALQPDVNNIQTDWLTPVGGFAPSPNNPPWYGQKEIFFSQLDPRGAARPARNMPWGGEAHMETQVNVPGPSPVSFFWKVDSDQMFVNRVLVAHNYLAFSINGEIKKIISGLRDWQQETFILPEAGTYTLRWSYIKEIPSGAGTLDTGWVDRVTLSAPNLVLENLEVLSVGPADGAYEPGVDSLRYRATIRNAGTLGVPHTPSYFFQLRLSPATDTPANLDWSKTDASQIVLHTLEMTNHEQRALAPGEYFVIEDEVPIPGGSPSGNYFLGAWIDYTNRITETSYQDNLRWTDTRAITLLDLLSLEQVLGYLPDHPDGWVRGGAGAWFGQVGESDPNVGSGEAAQSPQISNNQKAWFEAEIEGPQLLSYSWKVSSRENFNFLRLYVSGKRVKEIHGEQDWTRVEDIFIPVGPQTIRWSYEKTSNSGNEDEDTGWVDGISLTPVTQPDLVITSVQHEPGPYVLERDRLTVTIVAENRGAQSQEILDQLGVLDIEVRLSTNRVFADDDDYILGHFARVDKFAPHESFTSGAMLVFSGDLYLPLNLSEGNYYLAAKIDSYGKFEDDEYDRENNVWIAENNDVRIRRLPHLISDQFTFDSSQIYYPYSPLEVDWVLRNRGLGDITGEVPYVQEIRLMAHRRNEVVLTDPIHVSTLSSFSDDGYLPGVSDVHPGGSGRKIYSRMTLPSPANILAGLREIPEGLEEDDGRVLGEMWKINGLYIYYIAIVTDSTIAIEQSSDLRHRHYRGDMFEIFTPGHQPATYAQWMDWERFWLDPAGHPDLSDPLADPLGDGVSNLMKYAFNLNRFVPHSGGASIYEAFGRVEIDGAEFFRITFDMVKVATDLLYHVEASSDLINWDNLMTIEPPYTDDHGPRSLAGVDGLIHNDLVISASDQGYTAAISVRDVLEVADFPEGGRFMRVRVEEK